MSGTLDLTDNALEVDYGGGVSPIDAIKAEIYAGYNGGLWNGIGITSSTAMAAPRRYALGYADGNVDTATIAQSGEVIVKYALLGDAESGWSGRLQRPADCRRPLRHHEQRLGRRQLHLRSLGFGGFHGNCWLWRRTIKSRSRPTKRHSCRQRSCRNGPWPNPRSRNRPPRQCSWLAPGCFLLVAAAWTREWNCAPATQSLRIAPIAHPSQPNVSVGEPSQDFDVHCPLRTDLLAYCERDSLAMSWVR